MHFAARHAVLPISAAALASFAAADTVTIDLQTLAAAAPSVPVGCSWDAQNHVLSLPSGEYFVWDGAWNAGKPASSGSFCGKNPGLSIVLSGDCSIAVSNVVAVSGASGNGVNSVIDLAGHDLSLALCGANVFSVKVESQEIGPAIHVPAGSRLSIDGDGSLYAHVYGGAPACIGSNHAEDSGQIVINGGTVAAVHQDYSGCRKGGASGLNGAAIGSGGAGNAGAIVINGGRVAATNECWGAAIGAGANYNGDGLAVSGAGAFDVTVTGGTVVAVGGRDGGCGIGGGHSYSRADATGACARSCPIRILGGSVTASAGLLGEKGSFHAECGASAIGASMFNAGAALVIDESAVVTILSASKNAAYNHNVVSGYSPAAPGSISVTCTSSAPDGHAFLVTSGTAKDNVADVLPADEAAAALPWFVFSKPAIKTSLVRSPAPSGGGVAYSLDPAAAGMDAAEFAAASGRLEGLPITAFSLDGNLARFAYSRVSSAPTAEDVAEFSAWFAAFGGKVVALARNAVTATEADVLRPDAGSAADNGDGTASFSVALPTPLPSSQFFQIAW